MEALVSPGPLPRKNLGAPLAETACDGHSNGVGVTVVTAVTASLTPSHPCPPSAPPAADTAP